MVSWQVVNAIFIAQFIIIILILILAYPISKKRPDIEIKRGIKASVSAILVYEYIFSIIFYLFFSHYLLRDNSIIFTMIIFSILYGLFMGAFFGIFYALFYTHLPSNSPIIKGMILGAAYSLYGTFNSLLSLMAIKSRFGFHLDISEYILRDLLISIPFIFFFGFLIGTFWNYLKWEEDFFYPKKIPPSVA